MIDGTRSILSFQLGVSIRKLNGVTHGWRCRQNDKWHVTCDELAKHFRSTAIPLPDLSLSSMARENHCFFMVIFWQCMAYFSVEFVGLSSKSASFHRLFCISPHLGKYFETCNSSTADSLSFGFGGAVFHLCFLKSFVESKTGFNLSSCHTP